MQQAAAQAPADPRAFAAAVKARLQEGQTTLRAAFEADGNARRLIVGRARLVDATLIEVWQHLAIPPEIALAAVGGYGRGELFPGSDVDILILAPGDFCNADAHRRAIEQLIGVLWDVGLEIGQSVRSVAECLAEAARDITVQTTLLEARFLCGRRELFDEFWAAFRGKLEPAAFFRAKRLEQAERYTRFNDTPYSLEPNCKESPGGLRDLQIIVWAAQAAGLGDNWPALARRGVITAHEARQLARAEDTLRDIRCRLHLMTRRREDRLLFDHQEGLARAAGIEATRTRRASEVLMQRYYRNAKLVTQLNTLVLQNLAAAIETAPPAPPIVIDVRFQSVRGLLDVRDDTLFEREPHRILEAFLLMQQRSELQGMTARTLRALWAARGRIDAAFRRDPQNRALFLQLFQQKRGLTHELRRMNQYDILGHYLPAFGRIVGQMQHDLFHVYTVDQHILQVIRNLRRFTLPEFAHEYPFCSRLITAFERPWVIYVAGLFHDIAKGRGGDHSRLGVADARRFCREHGIAGEDSDLIPFLVEHHLTMSAVAQKQDLADPDVIRAFAGVVKTSRRLTALYLLTVADIRGTSPKVWNAWKGKLLENLYHAALRVLQGDAPAPAAGLAVRQEEARGMLRFHGLRGGVEDALWRQLDTAYFMRHDAEEIAWHTRALYHRPDSAEPVVKARLNPFGEGLQVMIYVAGQAELFARLCGFFSRLGYSIVEAKIHTTRSGYALDSFVLLDPSDTLPYRDMIGLIEHDLVEQLQTRPPLGAPSSGRLSRQVRHFPFSPEVSTRRDEKGNSHIMSVAAIDRPGLLYAIARVLAQHGIDVQAAKISTLGERVEDTFVLSGNELGKTATLVQLEQELLEVLRV
ncbi:[protein-PII] uridylyltransferase [Sulfurisoma sediminicola]|uniref:Bifunctional uridylyltransferase/uridylyl-removing enzyme n=1 Tax=Sulfurisoma sediminicola TaxID=1381557 RepID=A0A497XDS2_9PROT|nr:[protein-PII] uridylyltransferase [Sulfurisoma sediminicola]RLJ65131.1 UTP--GlnB (protein PII) uridylyltransferase GlnD [Sulfurisoma sediminicola]